MLLEIGVREDKRHSGWQCQEGKCNWEKKGLGSFFCPDGIEKPEDSTGIRMGGQIRTRGLPGCRYGSRNDLARSRSIYVSEASDRCTSEWALRRSRTADSASWNHQALGE